MNYGRAYSPPCITARRGGCAVNKEVAKLPCSAQTGWFSFLFSIGKPPRPRDQRRLREIFLVARPPLLAAMQGGERRSIQHSFTRSLAGAGTAGAGLCKAMPLRGTRRLKPAPTFRRRKFKLDPLWK